METNNRRLTTASTRSFLKMARTVLNAQYSIGNSGSLGFRKVKVLDSPTLYLAALYPVLSSRTVLTVQDSVQDKCLLGARRKEPEQVRDSDTLSTQTPRDLLLYHA